MNKTFYFQHDYNAATDVKILFLRKNLGMEGYGIYWFLIEQLANAGGKLSLDVIPIIAMQCHSKVTKVETVIKNYSLFEIVENEFFSRRLNKHFDLRTQLSESGRKRKKSSHPEATLQPALSHPEATLEESLSQDSASLNIGQDRTGKDRTGQEKTGKDISAERQNIYEMFKRTTKDYTEDEINEQVNKFINYWYDKDLKSIGSAVNRWVSKLPERKKKYDYGFDPETNVW